MKKNNTLKLLIKSATLFIAFLLLSFDVFSQASKKQSNGASIDKSNSSANLNIPLKVNQLQNDSTEAMKLSETKKLYEEDIKRSGTYGYEKSYLKADEDRTKLKTIKP